MTTEEIAKGLGLTKLDSLQQQLIQLVHKHGFTPR